LQLSELGFNGDGTALALHLGLAVGGRHHRRASEVDFGGAAVMLVVDGLHGACGHVRDKHGRDTVGIIRRGGLGIGLSQGTESYSDSECK
jgi:hypothetical protein